MVFYVSIHPFQHGVEATLSINAQQVCVLASAPWDDVSRINEVRGWGARAALMMHYANCTVVSHEHEALDLLVSRYQVSPWATSKEYGDALLFTIYESEDIKREALRRDTEAMEGDVPWM
jgi:hypothetical protein